MTIFQWHTILHVRKKLSKASGAVLLLKPYVLGRNINMRQVRGAKHRQANYISKSDPEGPGMCGDSRRGTNKPEVFSIGQGTTARIGPSTESFPRERLWGGGHDGRTPAMTGFSWLIRNVVGRGLRSDARKAGHSASGITPAACRAV